MTGFLTMLLNLWHTVSRTCKDNISDALKLYRGKLTAFEQTEILDYPEIWFLGLEAKKIEGVPGGAQNNGYDDENGSYIKVSFRNNSKILKVWTPKHLR